MAEGSRYSCYVIEESSSGVTPSSGTLKPLRVTKSSLDINITTLQSEEIRDDAEIADYRFGARYVEGTLTGEFSYETFDELIGGVLRNTFSGNTVKGGVNRRSFTFVDYNADIPDLPYTIYRGCEVDSMTITVSAEAITSVEFAIVGRTMEQAAALPSGLEVGERTTTTPMDGFSGALLIGGEYANVITEMSIQVQNSIEARFVVGSKYSIKPSSKRREVTGSLTAYYEDNSIRSLFLNEQESAIQVDILDGTSGSGYRFSMPRIKITEAPRTIDGDGDITLDMSYSALLDQTDKYSISVTKLAPAKFTTDLPSSKQITVGDNLELSVEVSGWESPSYQWYKGGSKIVGETSKTYTKSSAAEDDSGAYYCEAKDDSTNRTVVSQTCVVNVAAAR